MTPEIVVKLADFYFAELVKSGAVPMKADETKYANTSSLNERLNHLAWACNYIKKLATEHGHEGVALAQQWLGFVQGALWDAGIFSIEEMRKHQLQELPVPQED
jgi:hypothetical protein